MKNAEYRNSKIKHQLLERKRRNVKEVIWKLSPEQKKFIEETLKFSVEVYTYEIKTRTFHNVSNLDSLLKDIHFAKKRGKNFLVRTLKPKQIKILEDYEVKYRAYKYKIKLC